METLPPAVREQFEEESERLFWRQLPLVVVAIVAALVVFAYYEGGGWAAFYSNAPVFFLDTFNIVFLLTVLCVSAWRWVSFFDSDEPILVFWRRRAVPNLVIGSGFTVMALGGAILFVLTPRFGVTLVSGVLGVAVELAGLYLIALGIRLGSRRSEAG